MEERTDGAGWLKPGWGRLAAEAVGRTLFPHFCLGCGAEGSLLCDECFESEDDRAAGVFWCPGCGAESARGLPCGDACREQVAADGLDAVISVWTYGQAVPRRLLQAWKYEGTEEAGELLLLLFQLFLERQGMIFIEVKGLSVVPLPLHPFRLAERGFNQAESIAWSLAGAWEMGRAVRTDLLRRRFQWRKQAKVDDPLKRRANAAGTVRLNLRPGQPVPERVILVDDVMTTGATLRESARVLKAAGCRWVGAVTVLRG